MWRDHRADVVVVGSGGLGAATAYYLSKRKGLSVALVDKHDIGSQTSPRAASMVSCARKGDLMITLIKDACRKIETFTEETGQPLDWVQKAASSRRRPVAEPRFHCLGGHRVAAAGAVDEMNVAALGGRGNEARHLRGLLPENAPENKVLSGGESRLQRVGEGGGAVERHTQSIVELAKVGVRDQLARVRRRVEAAHLQLEDMED